ncbi:esterase/lipase/thioesterase domain-containing protein [Toxoplasma gondii MAS]|uniref:Esterase/lipase/thioesterase domain-containing protein n=2 Tax=Toxoplasma gondii TaxID=5811 RepID=A0A086QDQ4_TOXGO|nr:esterase/lipase/thioesterase domain-containing protein [Toxoplasma gondii MAS]PUA90789.1 esterase/lipase/thioesterase domain-containing protein [Toxoplasma gondii TgCATBr9]
MGSLSPGEASDFLFGEKESGGDEAGDSLSSKHSNTMTRGLPEGEKKGDARKEEVKEGDVKKEDSGNEGEKEEAEENHRREPLAHAKRRGRRLSSGKAQSRSSTSESGLHSGRQRVPLLSLPFTTCSLAGSGVRLDGVLWVSESMVVSELSRSSFAGDSSEQNSLRHTHSLSPVSQPHSSSSREGVTETAEKGESKPRDELDEDGKFRHLRLGASPIAVFVHQYSLMGGRRFLVDGKARILASRGIPCITFDLRGAGTSGGRATLTGSSEVKDTVAVCEWAKNNLDARTIFLIGTSAGAAISGSAVPLVPEVKGWVGIGYTFGFFASLLFSRHFQSILESPKPKLFIHGGGDGFTSTSTFEHFFTKAAEPKEKLIVEDVGHFDLEGPDYDPLLCDVIFQFIEKFSATRVRRWKSPFSH